MSDCIRGLWAAMSTPLDADGNVDRPALVRHAQFLLRTACDGVVPFGTTGEGTSFSSAEKLAAAETLLAAGIPPARIALGTGTPAIAETVAATRAMLGLGIVHAMILPPYYYRDVDAAGIEDAFAAVIEGVGDPRLRVTAYHIPQVSGVPAPAAVLARLRARYGAVMAGVKDSTGDWESFLAFRREAPEIGALVGAEPLIPRALAAGGAGTICGMVNLVPALVRSMFAPGASGAPMQAAVDLLEAPFIAVIKAVLAAQTGDAAWLRVRPPLRPADAATGARIAAGLAALAPAAAAE
jgi:4-hydroxy-tetrahydrodipicolinate synthase